MDRGQILFIIAMILSICSIFTKSLLFCPKDYIPDEYRACVGGDEVAWLSANKTV